MKKLVICLFIVAGLILISKANAQKGFSAGVKVTPQFSFLENKDDNNNSNYESNVLS